MPPAYIVVIVSYGDGTEDYGFRIDNLRCRTKKAAEAIMKELAPLNVTRAVFVVED